MLEPYRLFVKVSVLAALAAVAAAQSLTGRVVDANGVGISGVSVEPSNGAPSGLTNATGNYTLTGLQNRTYAFVNFRPATNTIAAAELVNVRVQNATTLATVTLQPGALVTGVFVGPNGPIVGGNMNAYDHSGVKLFTPNDATNALGQFAIVVPTGLRTIRAVPPVGSGLVPVDRVITLTAPTNLGTLTTSVGFPVSMTIVDAVSGVPVNAVQVHTLDGATGLEIAQLQNTSSVFGAVTLQLPFGFYEVHLLPAGFPTATDGHAPRQIFGLVVTGPRNYGTVTMERGALVTGSVLGPNNAPVSPVDMDVLTPSGYKLWTSKDNTDAAGTFRVTIPLGTYRFTAQPPAGSGLAGATTALVQITGNTALPPIHVAPGVNLVLQVADANGPCANANLNMFDVTTGQPIVLVGDHADANGLMSATIPPGVYSTRLEAAQGAVGQTLSLPAVPIINSAFIPLVLPSKQVAVNVTGLGIQATGQNGQIPINVSLHNLQSSAASVLIDVVVRLSDGTEQVVLPVIPLTLPPLLTLGTGLMFIHVGTVPAAELTRTLQFIVRLRAPGTNAVLDQAKVDFVVY